LTGVKFRRHTCPGTASAARYQGHAIDNYIVDFCSPRRKLIIELDGGQHIEQQAYDEERTKFLEARGYRVLRFWNHDVINNIDSIVQVIWNVLNDQEGEKKR
jgi:very-short-patch-repair endonuclease